MPSSPPIVLTFAASDPTCGAGAQADVLTIAAMGCHPVSVLTALTVQSTHGVERIVAVEPGLVERQARALLEDVPVAAIKLGVLGSAENVRLVARLIAEHSATPVVLDPVLASARGDELASRGMVDALADAIVPHAIVMTPNSVEAQRLGGVARLLALGCRYVLVTGTHAPDADVVNRLYDAGGIVSEERWERLPHSYHGSGCTLASALAASLACGRAMREAAHEAQDFTWRSLGAGFRPGAGQHLPRRLVRA